jgi:cytochrome c-type biogenesis protein CcmF
VLVTGRACLFLALGMCAYGAVASIVGARTGRRDLIVSGRRAVYALALVLVLAFVILEAALLRSDFTFRLVGGHSSTTTPVFSRATAVWSSQEGSLLLWVWLLSLCSSLVLARTGDRPARRHPVRDTSSTVSPRARSASRPARAATCGPRSSPTSGRCAG